MANFTSTIAVINQLVSAERELKWVKGIATV